MTDHDPARGSGYFLFLNSRIESRVGSEGGQNAMSQLGPGQERSSITGRKKKTGIFTGWVSDLL